MQFPANATELVADYTNEGVVRVPGVFDARQVAEVRQQVDDYVKNDLPNAANPDCTFEEDGRTVRNLWRLDEYVDFFRDFAQADPIIGLVSELVGGEPVLMAVETFNKPALVGSGVPYHQDNAYFCQSPPDVLTMWIAIDPVTVENGPVYYIKGSHHEGLLPTKPSGTVGNSIGLATQPDVPLSDQFCCTLNSGDVAIHHCETIHHSAPNRSEKSRLGLLLVYRSAHTSTNEELKQNYLSAQG